SGDTFYGPPDGTYRPRVLRWEAATGKHLGTSIHQGGGPIHDVALGRDGALVVAHGPAVLWGAGVVAPRQLADGAYRVAFSPDGRCGAPTGGGGGVVGAALTGGTGATLPSARTVGVAFSPDGELLAATTLEGEVLLWDLAGASLLRTFRGPLGPSAAVAF